MIPGLVSGLFFGGGGGGVSMGGVKFYFGPHKSGKKEKHPYSNFFATHSLYHEYFTMSNTHMKLQVILLDLLTSTRKCHKISGNIS